MSLSLYIVDAFTAARFGGNPAGVCLLDQARPDAWLQAVAREVNHSETAFVLPRPDGDFDLRWFTPKTEVDLCGHATLASAHVLWQSRRLAATEPARFHSRSGLLTACRDGDMIRMDFPADPAAPCDVPPELMEALGSVELRYCGRNRWTFLAEVETEEDVRTLQPRQELLASLPVVGIIVTARAKQTDYDFVSRFFAPRVGIPEDPVTGSAHCVLSPYWAGLLGRKSLLGYQASARGGFVHTEHRGRRVMLGGRAVTVMRASLPAAG